MTGIRMLELAKNNMLSCGEVKIIWYISFGHKKHIDAPFTILYLKSGQKWPSRTPKAVKSVVSTQLHIFLTYPIMPQSCPHCGYLVTSTETPHQHVRNYTVYSCRRCDNHAKIH